MYQQKGICKKASKRKGSLRKEREKVHIDESFAYKWSDYPTKAAIVFVHGLGGTPIHTWGAFPQLIMGSSIGQNFDVFSYGYSSNVFFPTSPDLDSLIGEFSSFCQSELNQYDAVILISHSLGSVIVNGMLLRLEKSSISPKKYLAHMMITPAFFGGASWARLSLSKTARQLEKNSEYLAKLHEDWKNSNAKSLIKSYLIYGTKDGVVPIPKKNLKEFCFIEHRIQSDHIQSPKISDINSSLYRGVVFAIELALRFNSRDSRKYYINILLKTDKSDWVYDSPKEEWVYLNDFRFNIIELSSEQMPCCFNESFPDETAYQCKYAFRYNEIIIYEFYLWNLDGGRYIIPAPLLIDGQRVVEKYNYLLAKLLEAGGMYEDLDRGIKMAKIIIDESKDVIE